MSAQVPEDVPLYAATATRGATLEEMLATMSERPQRSFDVQERSDPLASAFVVN